MEANPAAFESQFNLGRILAAQGKFEQAIPHFEQAAKLSGGREALSSVCSQGPTAKWAALRKPRRRARRALAVTPPGDTRSVETLKARIAQYESLGRNQTSSGDWFPVPPLVKQRQIGVL